jgi:hypothetical protein
MQTFRTRLPFISLSRRFQDAMYATLSLGFHYLWIDSLCIEQNDRADWKQESEHMAKVYKNATCNLSVSGFSSQVDGFLFG